MSTTQDKNFKNINSDPRVRPFIKPSNINKNNKNIPQNQSTIHKKKEHLIKKNSSEKKEIEIRNKAPSYSNSKTRKFNETNIIAYQINPGKDKKIIRHDLNPRVIKQKILNNNLKEKNIEKEQLIQKSEKNNFIAKKFIEDNSLKNVNISNSVKHKNSCSLGINNISKEVKKFIPIKKFSNEGIKEMKSSFVSSRINNNAPNINFSNKNEFILLPNLKCKRRKTSAQCKQIQYISVGANKENINNSPQQQEFRENNFKQVMTFSRISNEMPKIKNQNMTNPITKPKNKNKYCIISKINKEKHNKILKKEVKVIINIKDISNSSTICSNNNKNINHLIKSTSDGYYSKVQNHKNKKISNNKTNYQKNYIKKVKIIKPETINNSPKISHNNYNYSTNNSSSHMTTSQKNNLSCQLSNDPYKLNKILSRSSKSIIEKKEKSVRESNKMQLNNNTNSTSNFTYIDKKPINNNNNNNFSSRWDNKCYIPIVSASLVCANKENFLQNFSLNLQQYENKCTEDYYDNTEKKPFLVLSNSNSFRKRRNKYKTERNRSINIINRGDNKLSLDYNLCLQEKELDEIHDELKNYGISATKRKNDEHSADFILSKELFNNSFNCRTKSLKDIFNCRRSGLLNEMRKIKYENFNTEDYKE